MKTLGSAVDAGADARQVAATSAAIWQAIHAALSPVIGMRGSRALYQRSLHLARADRPWLAAACAVADPPGEFGALHACLTEQPARDAAAAHDATLHIFRELLADLIGRSLTQRLLQSAWEPPLFTADAVGRASP